MNGWVFVAGILTVAGLDAIALAGGPLEIPALLAAFALIVAGICRLDVPRPPRSASIASCRSFAPDEGAIPLRWPLDYALGAALGAGSFVLSFAGYWRPDGSSCWTLDGSTHCGIFDELYFARAGEEYLRNLRIYENTHPPLSKLLVTLSMMLFGGMHGGDNPWGWRFLDVVFGALAIVVLYAFAKRLTGSTLFASIAAILFSVDGMHFVQSRVATPEGFVVFFATLATYALYRFCLRYQWCWLVLFAVALGCLVSAKWYGVMLVGVSFIVLTVLYRENRRSFGLIGALTAVVCISTAVYALSWMPDLVRQSPDPAEIHSLNDVIARQELMLNYHETLRATHPYASKWWEWPLDDVPVAYFYQDGRSDKNDPNGCCIREITSMPNPVILWLGLVSVPIVGWLAIARRHKGYFLIVLTYLMQWLPWMGSPRITFAYHFYVDVPLICLCNSVVLMRVPRPVAAAYVALAALAFVFFYPILSAMPITWTAWHARMWFPTWIIGPG